MSGFAVREFVERPYSDVIYSCKEQRLSPIIAVERAVIYRFADVGCLNVFAAVEIRDGARDL